MPGVIETSYSFTNNDTITSAKMNNIIDETTFISTAISGTTLQIVSGKLAVNSLGITSNELATNSVTVGKITDSCITPAKLSVGRPDWNDWTADASKVSTFILGYNRGASQSGATNLYFESSDGTVNAVDAIISREGGAVGQMSIENLYDPADTTTDTRGQINFGINSSVKMSIKQDGSLVIGDAPFPKPSGTAPIYGIRAFAKINIYNLSSSRTHAYKTGTYTGSTNTVTVTLTTNHNLKANDVIRLVFVKTGGTGTNPSSSNIFIVTSVVSPTSFTVTFNGVGTASGTVTAQFIGIQSSKNISSVSAYDSGANAFVLNFDKPMPDINYCIIGTGSIVPGGSNSIVYEYAPTTGAQLGTVNQAYAYVGDTDRLTSILIIG